MSASLVGATRISSGRVLSLGIILLAVGTLGFYHIPGMINEEAKGLRLVNAFYCSAVTLTTVGFGDVCPGTATLAGRAFLICFALGGIGIFGAVLELASAWHSSVPGGSLSLLSVALGAGMTMFTLLEGHSQSEALYASVVTGTTIGYGDKTPSTDTGKLAVAMYAIFVVNVMAIALSPVRALLEQFCRVPIMQERKEADGEDDRKKHN